MQSNTSALPLGNHLPAEAINAGNAFLSRAAPEPARHVTYAERRQGGGHVGGGGTRGRGRRSNATRSGPARAARRPGGAGSPPPRHRRRAPVALGGHTNLAFDQTCAA